VLQGRRAFIAAALALLPLLASCQPPWQYFVINNTGAPIEIVSSRFEHIDQSGRTRVNKWDRWEPWPMVIRHNLGRVVQVGGGGSWRLEIRANNCLLSFDLGPELDLPNSDPTWQFRGYSTVLQLERDGRLYFAPLNGNPPAPAALDQIAPVQPPHFPMEPRAKRCGT
jgi:hypothetical protein